MKKTRVWYGMICLTLALLFGGLAGSALGASFGTVCDYTLKVNNSLGMSGSDAPDIEIKNVKLKYIDVSQWKEKTLRGNSKLAVEPAATYSATGSVDAFFTCFSYKFSFDWKCSTQSDYQTYTTQLKDYPAGVNNGTTRTVEFDNCSSGGDADEY